MFKKAAMMIDMTEDYLGKAIWVHGDTGFRQEELDLRKDIIDPVLKELSSEIEERRISVENTEGFYEKTGIFIRGNKICWKSIFITPGPPYPRNAGLSFSMDPSGSPP